MKKSVAIAIALALKVTPNRKGGVVEEMASLSKGTRT